MYVYIRSLKFTVESSGDLGVPFCWSSGLRSISRLTLGLRVRNGRPDVEILVFRCRGSPTVFWRQLGFIAKYLQCGAPQL